MSFAKAHPSAIFITGLGPGLVGRKKRICLDSFSRLPVLMMVSDDPVTFYFMRSGIIFLNDMSVVLLIYVPKVMTVKYGSKWGMQNIQSFFKRTSASMSVYRNRRRKEKVKGGREDGEKEDREKSDKGNASTGHSGVASDDDDAAAAASNATHRHSAVSVPRSNILPVKETQI